MKINQIIYTLTTLSLLTACSDDLLSPTHTVGEANNAITLRAGINEGSTGVQTRAIDGNHNPISNEIGGGHKTLDAGTKLRLRVDGTWLGKGSGSDYSLPHGKVTNNAATQTTTATVGAETATDSKHNNIELDPKLYWDDYGTADPANRETPNGTAQNGTGGREKGLTIYGVAVDGYKSNSTTFDLPSELSNLDITQSAWQSLSWTLDQDQKTNDWKNKDLLISNNVKTAADADGTLKFDDLYPTKKAEASDLLEFTHAMSKITVRLIAGDGFPTDATGTVGATTKKFRTAPEVKLTGDEGNASTNAWANTKCNVNVETGDISNVTTPAVITMLQGTVPETQKTQYTAIYEGLVVPGSIFGAPKIVDSKEVYPVIARINADGNIYYVTSEKIRAKMLELNPSTNYTTESGKNYIIQVTVNKTEIKVTATVTNWIDVTAAPVEPEINVSVDWTTTEGASSVNGFSFYRSESSNGINKGYSAGLTPVNNFYPAEAIASKPANDATTNQWPFKNSNEEPVHLFWPTHNTHYQFRGVWPQTITTTGDNPTAPRVRKLSNDDETQVIDIKNVAYAPSSYPSDLMIARPEFTGTTDPLCKNSETGHTQKHLYSEGICAVNGLVTMNFRYVMSQVEVILETSGDDSPNKVKLDANTKVDIVNVYNNGYVKLGDREIGYTDTQQSQTYTLDRVTGNGNELKRHSAILPQAFIQETAGASTNTRFKITVTNDDNTTDVYYADIKPIKKKGTTTDELVAPNGKWESGVHYIYTLLLTKTEIKVTATLTDWVSVEASDDIWF